MSLLNHVAFAASEFEDDEAQPAANGEDDDAAAASATEPAGRALAAFVDAGLRELGWNVDYHWVTDYSHAFDCRAVKRRYDVNVQAIDSDRGHWLITAKQRSGLFPRIFRGGVDHDEHLRLLLDVHSVLSTDQRIQDVAWFSEAAWRERGDTGAPGAASPEA